MVESKSFPKVQKLQGVWIIPCCVQEVQREDDEGVMETFYRYQEIRLDGSKPQLADVRKHVLTELNRQNNSYILSHYGQGTQQKFQQLWDNPDVSQTVKDQVKLVSDWIDTVLAHYYEKKKYIRDTASTIDEIMQVQWDFSQFDASQPDISLEGLMVG